MIEDSALLKTQPKIGKEIVEGAETLENILYIGLLGNFNNTAVYFKILLKRYLERDIFESVAWSSSVKIRKKISDNIGVFLRGETAVENKVNIRITKLIND